MARRSSASAKARAASSTWRYDIFALPSPRTGSRRLRSICANARVCAVSAPYSHPSRSVAVATGAPSASRSASSALAVMSSGRGGERSSKVAPSSGRASQTMLSCT